MRLVKPSFSRIRIKYTGPSAHGEVAAVFRQKLHRPRFAHFGATIVPFSEFDYAVPMARQTDKQRRGVT